MLSKIPDDNFNHIIKYLDTACNFLILFLILPFKNDPTTKIKVYVELFNSIF